MTGASLCRPQLDKHNHPMTFRLRTRIKLFPGLWLNASKTGVSVSTGVPGLTVSSGHGTPRMTASLPGTGLSYVSMSRAPHGQTQRTSKIRPLFWLLLVVAVVGTSYTFTL